MPHVYKDFMFTDIWGVNSKKNYAKGTPGYIAAASSPNAVWSGLQADPGTYSPNTIDSYVNPAQNFLFDFEEVTITLDLPQFAQNKSVIDDVQIYISVLDACGIGSYYTPYIDLRNPYFYYRNVVTDKLQFTFSEPLKAISSISIYASHTSGDYSRVEVFIDNFRYRKYDGPTPGCFRCGRFGASWCEAVSLIGAR